MEETGKTTDFVASHWQTNSFLLFLEPENVFIKHNTVIYKNNVIIIFNQLKNKLSELKLKT